MFEELIEKLTVHWRRYFFIEPILILILISCFIVGLFNINREKERLFFVLYFFVGTLMFIVFTTLTVVHAMSGRKWAITIEFGNTIFELVEFFAFYQFFKKSLPGKRYDKGLIACLICFCFVVGIFFAGSMFPSYQTEDIRKHSLFINVIELFFIFCMCLTYYYDLFTAVPRVMLIKRPSFFITTSTFFYSVLLIPFLILARDIMITNVLFYHILFAVHLFLLIIVLLTILRAFLLRIPITT
jgi:hypothetical protein